MDDSEISARAAARFDKRTHLTPYQMAQLMLPNDLPEPVQDCFVPHRDPAIVAPIVGEVFAEIARRQTEGHHLIGGSFEAEVVWLSGNYDGVDRQALIATIASLVQQVALIRKP